MFILKYYFCSMKETKDDLYNLIQSLNNGEKRLITTRLKYAENKDYLNIFNFYKTQKTYKEAKFKIYIETTSFANNTAVKKHKLYNKCLQYLQVQRRKEEKTLFLNEQIEFLQFYFEKGLYKRLQKELTRLEKECLQLGYFQGLLKISEYQIHLLVSTRDIYINKKMEKEIVKSENYLIEFNTQVSISNNASLINTYTTSSRTKELHNKVEKLYDKSRKLYVNAVDFKTKMAFLKLEMTYYHYIINTNEFKNSSIKLLDCTRGISDKFMKNKRFIALSNCILAHLEDRDYDGARFHLKQFNSYKLKDKHLIGIQNVNILFFGIRLFLDKQDYKGALVFIKNHKDDISIVIGKYKRRNVDYLIAYVALFYFYNKEYKNAIQFCILNRDLMHEQFSEFTVYFLITLSKYKLSNDVDAFVINLDLLYEQFSDRKDAAILINLMKEHFKGTANHKEKIIEVLRQHDSSVLEYAYNFDLLLER